MTVSEIIFLIIETIGVIAFAVSGAMKGIVKGLDVLGVVVLALITTLGGGLMRDVLLGSTPKMFVEPRYFFYEAIDIVVAIICFIYVWKKSKNGSIKDINTSFVLHACDAVGISVFCVFGIKIAVELGNTGFVFLVCIGAISSVGGGMLRDILVGEIPAVFRKYIYITPVLCGSILYILTTKIMPDIVAVILSIVFISVFRFCAIIFKWNLPSIKNVMVEESKHKLQDKSNCHKK